MRFRLSTQFCSLLLLFGLLPAAAQTSFFTETFSDETSALANWTSGGINEGSGTWEWSDAPFNPFGGVSFAAPTALDGFMFFNSDANGIFDHEITLTSAGPIDCSGTADVFLEMYTQYIYYNLGRSMVELGISTNGTDFVYQEILSNEEVETGYVFESAQRVVVRLPDAINQPTVYLRIRWTGTYEYYLRVDDIALYETNPILVNDLDIFNVRQPSAYRTPLSQVDSMFFIGMTENIGADPQTNVRMRVTILDADGDQVYQDSSESRSTPLAAGGLDTMFVEKGFLPNAVGEYVVVQTVLADETDDFASNNRHIFSFQVTEDLFSVDDTDPQFYSIGIPDEVVGDFWEGGNYFYVPNGQGYEAHNAQFMIWSDDDTHIGQTITILLFKIDEDNNPGFTNADVETVAFSSYTFGPDDESFTLIDAPLYQDDGETVGIPLEDSSEYILMLSLPETIGIVFTTRDLVYDVGSVVRNGDWFLGGFEGPLAMRVRMGIREVEVAAKEPLLPDGRISAFPNPVRERYHIDLDLENSSQVQLQLMNAMGQVLRQREYGALQRDRIDLDVHDLAAGQYLVKVRTAEGIKMLKLTKQ